MQKSTLQGWNREERRFIVSLLIRGKPGFRLNFKDVERTKPLSQKRTRNDTHIVNRMICAGLLTEEGIVTALGRKRVQS